MSFYQSLKDDDSKLDIEMVITNIKSKLRRKYGEFDDIEFGIGLNQKYKNQLCDEDFDRIMERLRKEMRECRNCIDLLNEQLEACRDIQLGLKSPEPFLDILLEHDHEAKSAYGS